MRIRRHYGSLARRNSCSLACLAEAITGGVPAHHESWEPERLRHKPPEQDGGKHGGHRGDDLDRTSQPVLRVPQIPHFHHMGCAAGNEQDSEEREHPAKRKIAAFGDEPQQSAE